MTMEEVFEDMEKAFKRNHPLLAEMYERYKTFRDISDEWLTRRKPIVITGASTGTEVLPEEEWATNTHTSTGSGKK